MRNAPVQRSPPVVRVRHRRLAAALDCDVAVCGGTLGLFIALALQLRGHRVTVVEKRRVEGRTQEWNVSRAELDVRPVLVFDPRCSYCLHAPEAVRYSPLGLARYSAS